MTPLERAGFSIITYVLFVEARDTRLTNKTFKAMWTDGRVEWVFDVDQISWDRINIKERKVQAEMYNERGSLLTGSAMIRSEHRDRNDIYIYSVDKNLNKMSGRDKHGQFEIRVSGYREVEVWSVNEDGRTITRKYRIST